MKHLDARRWGASALPPPPPNDTRPRLSQKPLIFALLLEGEAAGLVERIYLHPDKYYTLWMGEGDGFVWAAKAAITRVRARFANGALLECDIQQGLTDVPDMMDVLEDSPKAKLRIRF